MSTNEPVDVVVVGAGLAGLAAAARAATNGCRVVVVDGRSPGGRARTDDREGFAFNQGPHALYKAGPGASVLRRLGLTPTGGRPPLERATAWRDGELWPLPFTATGLLTTRVISARAKTQVARFFASVAAIRSDRLAELSAAAWLSSLDLRADALQLVSALTRVATYASNLELLSADAAARQNQLALRGGVIYLDGGWQTLVDGLVRRATDNGASILAGRAAQGLDGHGPDWVVRTNSGELRAASVILAVGDPEATRRLLPVDPGWDAGWDAGVDATAACLDLGVRRPPAHRVAFGLDEPLYLSTHCPPAQLAPAGSAVVHVMRYGARGSEVDRPNLEALAHRAGIDDADIVTQRFLHRMVVAHRLPQPGLGLRGRPPVQVQGMRGVFVAGDWVGPVGLLADASLVSAEAAAVAAKANVQRSLSAA
jgi:phytoene dehydrogenase-like protein